MQNLVDLNETDIKRPSRFDNLRSFLSGVGFKKTLGICFVFILTIATFASVYITSNTKQTQDVRSKAARPEWIIDDSGIQKFYQDKVPQFTTSGKIQYSFTNDSFFPLGLYHVDIGSVPDTNGNPQGQIWNTFHLNSTTSRNTLPELKTAGFNTIMRFISFNYHSTDKDRFPVDFTPNEYELDLLDSYGIKAYVEMLGPAMWSANNYNGWNLDVLKSTVARIKKHLSVLGYHLFDEIQNEFANIWPMDEAKWKIVHDTIKSIDPDRPVFANANNRTCFPSSFNDFSSFDRYTKREDLSGKMDLTDFGLATSTKRTNNCPLPILAILQAVSTTQTPKKFLPTPAEVRAQYYTAIVNGATGIAAFTQYSTYISKHDLAGPWNQIDPNDPMQGMSPQVNTDLWNAASQANHEIETWKQVFLSKTSTDEYHVSYKDSHSGGVLTLLKDTGDGSLYLLAVGEYLPAGSSAVRLVKFTFPLNKKIVKVTSVFDNLNIPVQENSFSSAFRIGDVRFYKIEFAPNSTVAPNTVGPGTYEDNSNTIVYSGTWIRRELSIFSGGISTYSNKTGDTASLIVNGANNFSFTIVRGFNRGIGEVLIDSQVIDKFDGYASSQTPGVVIGPYRLPDVNSHKISIRVKGIKNTSSSDYFVQLDNFIIRYK